jgi:hypothetical protein
VVPIPDKEGYVELPAPPDTKISTRPNFIERRTNLVNRCKILFPLPKYPTPDSNKITFFGNGFYPQAYYQDSFVVNSDFKKLLIKDDLNGIKYLSCLTNDKYEWTMFYIDTNLSVTKNDKLIIKGFFKDTVIYTDLEMNFLNEKLETNTNRIQLDFQKAFVSDISLNLKDYYDISDNTILTSIKFILYTKYMPCSELCLTEVSVEKSDGN